MTIQATTVPTPLGDFALLVRDDVLIAAGFGSIDDQASRLPDEELVRQPDLGRFSDAITAYFAGDVHAIDDLPVAQSGGDFRQAAWKVMREVPAGETISYAELASRAGSAKAVRAAGSACSRNMVALVVPCHRIVSTGSAGLGGYYYGLPTKEWLLAHERTA
ncbi:MAG TPA: methylated-DNA--[protein]-cysteine S-methyltransferase [Mycobacteriales bacterium]|nr:methylated-DNA--[protein]-cysteine S-methyltransferase [Mycobacteriales bacterium]